MDTPILILGIVCSLQFLLNVWTAIRMVETMDDVEDLQLKCDILEEKMSFQEDVNKIPY